MSVYRTIGPLVCLFRLRLSIPINSFTVILGWLPGFNQYYAMGMKCVAHGHNTVSWMRIEPTTFDQGSEALPTELSVLPNFESNYDLS